MGWTVFLSYDVSVEFCDGSDWEEMVEFESQPICFRSLAANRIQSSALRAMPLSNPALCNNSKEKKRQNKIK